VFNMYTYTFDIWIIVEIWDVVKHL